MARGGSKRIWPVGSNHTSGEAWEVTEVTTAAGLFEGGVGRVKEASRHPSDENGIRFVPGKSTGNREDGAARLSRIRRRKEPHTSIWVLGVRAY